MNCNSRWLIIGARTRLEKPTKGGSSREKEENSTRNPAEADAYRKTLVEGEERK